MKNLNNKRYLATPLACAVIYGFLLCATHAAWAQEERKTEEKSTEAAPTSDLIDPANSPSVNLAVDKNEQTPVQQEVQPVISGDALGEPDKNTTQLNTAAKSPFQTGIASYYGKFFHGRKTANGEIFNRNTLTAAHPTLPFGTQLKITNTHNNQSVVVRINDRGPYKGQRIIDLSQAAAAKIGMIGRGLAQVVVEILHPQSK